MCNLNLQASRLLGIPPILPPTFIQPLINAYLAEHPIQSLNLNVFAEPYYGDFNNCSAVLMTHNPGQATITHKGQGSNFDNAISAPPLPKEINYFNMSIGNLFPNRGTVQWVNSKNNEINNLFYGSTVFTQRLFIRDLVPYHGQVFGSLPMLNCVDYLYEHFFCQVINASLNTELYRYLNRNKSKTKSSILLARGSAWIKPQGLISVGWILLGRIYSNCYIYKADFNIIKKIVKGSLDDWPLDILSHDIYIMVITPKKGGRVIIYKKLGGITNDFTAADIVNNYDTINQQTNRLYIDHSIEMDEFINTLR
jgi:hypothetical protein